MDYKLGIEEDNHEVSPLGIDEVSLGIERWDRSKLTGARPTEIVPGDNGLYAGRDSNVHQQLPFDSTFVKP
jgi:hypothetical protein